MQVGDGDSPTADARISPLGPISHEPADRNRRNAARRIWSAVDRSSRQAEAGGSVGAGGAGTDFLRLTGAAFLTAVFLAATFFPAAFFATAFFGAAFFAGFFTALFFTAALRVAFFATTLRAVGLTAVFAAFLAGDFFAATFFVIFFAAAFAIVISPSRLIPSCENAFARRTYDSTLTLLFFSDQANARRSKGFRALAYRIITRARQSTRSAPSRFALPRVAPRPARETLDRLHRRLRPGHPIFPQ
jgi:hypothetical protein